MVKIETDDGTIVKVEIEYPFFTTNRTKETRRMHIDEYLSYDLKKYADCIVVEKYSCGSVEFDIYEALKFPEAKDVEKELEAYKKKQETLKDEFKEAMRKSITTIVEGIEENGIKL